MKIDLKKIFQPVTNVPEQAGHITTLISDVFGTLIDRDGKFNEPLAEFLSWLDKRGATVLIASNLPDEAERQIRRLDTKGLLATIAIHEKMDIIHLLPDENYAVIDDEIMLWFDAAISMHPNTLKDFLASRAYEAPAPRS